MYRKFVNARSPMRLLEKGLHGGLGVGNLGACVADHGVGKSSFLVGVAIDELLRGGTVLHVALDQTVSHVRDYYDTVYKALAESTHLDEPIAIHAEIDNQRRIRSYRRENFSASKLSDALKVEAEAGVRPSLIVIDGLEAEQLTGDDLAGIRSLAHDLAAEVWFTLDTEGERGLPASLSELAHLISVVVTLESSGDEITLRAIKDHENEDLHDLHVGLDPRTLLLIRS
jgi:KaiC/GvpD/RAD55 family RecA-like ATPase